MPVPTERRIRLPPDARSASRARRMLTEAIDEAGVDPDLGDTVVLLASELCENAVMHAGTEFDLVLVVAAAAVTVSVTDRGGGALELHLLQPRRGYGRAATHGRGLELVSRLATTWGTRHEADGRHTIWFAIATATAPTVDVPAPPGAPDVPVGASTGHPESADVDHPVTVRSAAEQARRIAHVPPGLADRLHPEELVSELLRRLRAGTGAASVAVELDEGDGAGPTPVAHDGSPLPETDSGQAIRVPLPVTPPLRGTLTAAGLPSGATQDLATELAELVAQRIGVLLQSRWLRDVDQRRRAWLSYLAETGELLGQSLDVDLTVTVVPQVVVPRLGRWCAVHLVDAAGRLGLAALTHADEDEIPELRAVLDPDARPGIPPRLRDDLHGLLRAGTQQAVPVTVPTDGFAVPLRSRGVTIGTLLVGRPTAHPHSPEDVVLIGDIARRAALAVQNAQGTAAHVAVAQALQRALLPRTVPVVPGVEFAATYLPASGGRDGSDVGGDFYDVLTVDPQRWLVSIGDVCGKGARAAARTGLVRDVLRVLVRGGRALTPALELLNEVMMEAADPMQYCTLAAAAVSRRAGGGLDVELVLAGHPRAVLVRAGGTVEPAGAFGTAVGLLPAITLTPTHHHLEPGDALLVHTDGVTERRRGVERFGTDRLLSAAAGAAGRTAAELVTAVQEAVQRFSPGPGGDDLALLAVQAAV